MFSYTYSFCKSFVIVSVLWLFFPNTIITEAAPSYRAHICTNETTYTSNTTFQSNLNLVLSYLSSNDTTINGFYKATAGPDVPDVAYGLFLCRGDVAGTDVCQDCVAHAVKETVEQYCPNQKKAIIWYDECMLRYANQSFFSTMEESPNVNVWNPNNVTEQDRFEQLLGETVDDLANLVSNDESGNVTRFATQEADFTAFQKLHSLAQCTPDLSRSDCNRCLRVAISILPTCCVGKQGGRVLLPSCNIRFEISPFYTSVATVPPPTPILLSPPPPARTPLASPQGKGIISSQTIVVIVVSVGVSAVLLSVGCCFLVRRAKKRCYAMEEENVGSDMTTVESLQFDLGTIEAATNNFSIENKIGRGRFGQVYKGTLPSGQEIAVKRLSKRESSGQGTTEFRNEVVVVAKLQHRNLVRLMGFCLAEEEKILIYEYVRNKSLDLFLFDVEKQGQLDWSRRYNIIGGIARGMLYLHEDSTLRIIHRDLKVSNILLDGDMNPKISDFGLAKIFGVDQSQGNTRRIVGTVGYISPEYAMHGKFSVKSDVFSFGVLILEIISGKKSSNFYKSRTAESLLSYAWKQWRNGTPLELMDSTLKSSYSRNEVVRCIHIGLLCVQEDMEVRPSMASVSLMLSSLSVSLPLPRKPAFFAHSRTEYLSLQPTSKSREWSVNEASITELYPR
ncbi:cysteine-rich receptor-like protein kinase 10 [Cornus florida]|uniref:cysteine-rich receptor-like protein kinase 10 n=1 Tax=Cornus florida TaxID=4283 RepID=UPI00289DD45D|nr:cysteine-rich receptor-like protein kinase 10 [Cornus florida]